MALVVFAPDEPRSFADEPPGPAWATRVLRDQSIETEPAALVAWLRERLPNDEVRARIERLVNRLGNPDYEDREAATRALREMGPLVLPRVRALVDDGNLEVAARAKRIVRDVEREAADGSESTTMAVLALLRERPTPLVVEPLLESLPDLPRGRVHDLACETLWRSVTPEHRAIVRRSLRRGGRVDPAQVVALEASLPPDDSADEIRGFLRSDDEAVRLAAVRALLDRDLPAVTGELAQLLAAKDPGVRERANVLARMLLIRGQLPSDGVRWRGLVETGGSRTFGRRPVGDARWIVTEFDTVFAEFFTGEPTDILRTYRAFRVESKQPVNCSVRDGVLRIPPCEKEADARLALDLAPILGDEPTGRLRVVAELASDGVSPVAWHPAVSVGRLKFLFHPGYSTGALRIEDVDTHEPILGNTSMKYTPRTNVFHRVTIDLTFGNEKSLRMQVRDVGRPEDGFECSAEGLDANEVNRVGLERSGRDGGTAMFRSLIVERQRPDLDWTARTKGP